MPGISLQYKAILFSEKTWLPSKLHKWGHPHCKRRSNNAGLGKHLPDPRISLPLEKTSCATDLARSAK
jgi:hypothetical protein